MHAHQVDPYHVLGVKSTSSSDDIKKAYRRLARENHPDAKPGDKRAEERFKDISSAYDLLSNPHKRRQFDDGEIDAQGNKRAGFGGHESYGYSSYNRSAKKSAKNPFNNFFKDRASRTGSSKKHQSIKANGADVGYTLKVSFLEAANGADKTVRMTTGKTLKVRIPKGTEHGQSLRLKGQGMNGIGGGHAGDALVEIHIEDDTQFKSDALDVFSEENVTLQEALLGGRIEVRTTHGPVLVTVPEGSNTGSKLRLKGKGLHKPGTSKRGDHYVTLKIVLPDDENADLKKLVKKWAAKHDYSVRKETLKRNAAE